MEPMLASIALNVLKVRVFRGVTIAATFPSLGGWDELLSLFIIVRTSEVIVLVSHRHLTILLMAQNVTFSLYCLDIKAIFQF